MANRWEAFRGIVAFVLSGGPNSDGLPTRVIAEIERREDAAERLIGWVQLAILLAFTLLYALATRAEGTLGANFVPAALAAYLTFTLFRVILSYRITLPWWFLILSMITDVALLCGLIFSFHIQYAQPAAFYLKSPTMIFLFIFISVRALRFDPRFVLMAGLIAALGWSLMVFYALTSDMGEMYITRNYVEYLTSNSILIGAEVEKILTILGVTFVLSLALYRARFVLFVAAQSSSAADDLRRFFSPEVASSITSSDTLPGAGHSETHEASILFIDVRGFTNAAEALPAETVMQVLSHYQKTALTEVQAFNGRVDKFMGDGILATFGAVEPNKTHAADALRAATAVIKALDLAQVEMTGLGWPGRFLTGAAVASGQVTVGVIGANGRLEFTVIGNAVNRAAKLENANKDHRTRALTDAATLQIAQSQGYERVLKIRPAAQIAGMSHPVDLCVLA